MKRSKLKLIVFLIAAIISMTSILMIFEHEGTKALNIQNSNSSQQKTPIYNGKDKRNNGDSWPMHLYSPVHHNYVKIDGPTTDEVLWSNATGGKTYGSPAIVDGKVYIGSRNGSSSDHDFMNSYYANNGTIRWRFETFEKVNNGYGVTSSPAVDNSYIFFGADRLYCLYANNGTMKWNIPTGNQRYGDGTPTVANGKVFIGACDRKAYCIDQDSGDIVWTYQTKTSGSRNYGVFAAPAVVDGFVYVAGADGTIYKINETQPTTTATSDHTYNTGRCIFSSPVVANGRVYFGNGYTTTNENGYFFCLDANDLSLIWKFDPGEDTGFFSSAGYLDGKIYTGSTDSNFYCLQADGDTPTVIWKYNTGAGIWSSPVIANDRLYFGSQSNYIYCFNTTQGGIPDYFWRCNMNGDIDSSPALVNGKIFVGAHGNGGKIYCFGQSGGDITPPYVESNSPINDDTNLSITTTISITFSELMNETSVEEEIATLPAIGYATSWEDKTIILTPDSDLEYTTKYKITISTKAKDLAGNPMEKEYSFNFTTESPPEIESTIPTNNSENVSISTTISLRFSKSMNKTSVEDAISIVPVFAYSTSWDDKIITMTPNFDLEYSTKYIITIETNAKDLAGNPLQKEFSFDFTTDTPPKVESTFPLNNSIKISVLTTISITFSEPMNETSVENSITTLPVFAYTTSWNDRTLTLILSTNLEYLTKYNLTIETTAKDLAEYSLVMEHSFSFTTEEEGDTTPPEILSTIPKNRETNIKVNTTAMITFSESMNHTSVESAINITPLINFTVSWNGNIMNIIPDIDFEYLTNYTITIEIGAMDLANNSLEVEYVFYFLTVKEDKTPPFVKSTFPTNNSKDIFLYTAISITFSEQMNNTSVESAILTSPLIEFNTAWDGNKISLLLISDLEYFTEYTITIKTGAKDLAGNFLEEDYSFSFTTIEEPDTTSPKITSTNPNNGQIDVLLDTKISITFSEEMNHTSVESSIIVIPSCDYTVTWNGNISIITPKKDLEYLKNYTITIGTQAKDLAGNFLEEEYNFSFITKKDTTPPTIDFTNIKNKDIDVSVDTTISITFSELINKTSVEDAITITPSINYTLSWKENILTITTEIDLQFNTKYTITIETNIKDIGGNFLEEEYNFSFTTKEEGDTIPPTILSTNPENKETDVQINTIISITFSEEMNFLSIENAISITPSIIYTHSWNGNTITLTPKKDLEYLTNYSIIVGTQAMDLVGNNLENSFDLTFTTKKEPETPDIIPPTINHAPVIEVKIGESIEIKASITDDFGVKNVILHYRKTGTQEYKEIVMTSEGYEYYAIIPAPEVTAKGLEYYIWATDGINIATTPEKDAAKNPYKITVKEEKDDESSKIIYIIPIMGIIIIGIIGFIFYKMKSSSKPPSFQETENHEKQLPQMQKCPFCNAEMPLGLDFCNVCGHRR